MKTKYETLQSKIDELTVRSWDADGVVFYGLIETIQILKARRDRMTLSEAESLTDVDIWW